MKTDERGGRADKAGEDADDGAGASAGVGASDDGNADVTGEEVAATIAVLEEGVTDANADVDVDKDDVDVDVDVNVEEDEDEDDKLVVTTAAMLAPTRGTTVHLLPPTLVMNWPAARLALVDMFDSCFRAPVFSCSRFFVRPYPDEPMLLKRHRKGEPVARDARKIKRQ